jgi:hypothetical protein
VAYAAILAFWWVVWNLPKAAGVQTAVRRLPAGLSVAGAWVFLAGWAAAFAIRAACPRAPSWVYTITWVLTFLATPFAVHWVDLAGDAAFQVFFLVWMFLMGASMVHVFVRERRRRKEHQETSR